MRCVPFQIPKQEESEKQNHRLEFFTMLQIYVCTHCTHYESPAMGKTYCVIFLCCINKLWQNFPEQNHYHIDHKDSCSHSFNCPRRDTYPVLLPIGEMAGTYSLTVISEAERSCGVCVCRSQAGSHGL